MMPNLACGDLCTGCTACAAACPKSCIKMERDEEGFLQPVVGDDCIGCGACERACPIVSGATGNPTVGQTAVAAVARDCGLWRASSSGGAFSCLCDVFAQMGDEAVTVVYGAAMDFPTVRHVGCEMPVIAPLRKSKYVQSDKGQTFRQVRDDLMTGRRVLYSGTPCEIAGLSAYLGRLRDSENLLLVDLICRGAGSPAVFEACMERASAKLGEVVDYEFRCKLPVMGNYERYLSMYKYLDKHFDAKTKFVRVDDYNKLFLNQACLRRSCMENCRFRNRKRFGDITLADLNGKGALYPEHDDGRGWSSIVGNTEKGRAVISRLSDAMEVYPSSPDDVARFNPLFDHTTPGNPRRDEFFARYTAGDDLGELVNEFGLHASLKSSVLIFVPRAFKRFVKRVVRAVKR